LQFSGSQFFENLFGFKQVLSEAEDFLGDISDKQGLNLAMCFESDTKFLQD